MFSGLEDDSVTAVSWQRSQSLLGEVVVLSLLSPSSEMIFPFWSFRLIAPERSMRIFPLFVKKASH